MHETILRDVDYWASDISVYKRGGTLLSGRSWWLACFAGGRNSCVTGLFELFRNVYLHHPAERNHLTLSLYAEEQALHFA